MIMFSCAADSIVNGSSLSSLVFSIWVIKTKGASFPARCAVFLNRSGKERRMVWF